MTDLFSESARRNPYPIYAKLREQSPVLYDSHTDCWMVFDYDSVKRVLSDHVIFSSSLHTATRSSPPWLVFTDPPLHTKLRTLIGRFFTPRAIAAFEARLKDVSKELLDRIDHHEFDLVDHYAAPFPMTAIAELIGIPAHDRERYKRWSEAIMGLSYAITGGEAAERAGLEYVSVSAEMREYLAHLMQQRKDQPREDLLTSLSQATVDYEALSLDDILGFFQLLISAGQETTGNLIANAVLCLTEHPEVQEWVRADPTRIAPFIDEVLRYRSPVQLMFRATRSSVVLGNKTIPERSLVLPMIGSANRDPKNFEDPNVFVVGRNPHQHLAFGVGIHFCLGSVLAKLEATIALNDLLRRYREIKLSPKGWEPHRALHILGPSHLFVTD